jgi:hypothetical protein
VIVGLSRAEWRHEEFLQRSADASNLKSLKRQSFMARILEIFGNRLKPIAIFLKPRGNFLKLMATF